MLPALMSYIPALTTIVSLFTLVYIVGHRRSACLSDLRDAIRDKPWQITRDGNL